MPGSLGLRGEEGHFRGTGARSIWAGHSHRREHPITLECKGKTRLEREDQMSCWRRWLARRRWNSFSTHVVQGRGDREQRLGDGDRGSKENGYSSFCMLRRRYSRMYSPLIYHKNIHWIYLRGICSCNNCLHLLNIFKDNILNITLLPLAFLKVLSWNENGSSNIS